MPFLFLTLGLSWLSWKMRMLSSRSSTSISRAASCCSRRLSSSSCDFCCRAARVSSSSRDRSSCRRGQRQRHLGLPRPAQLRRPPAAGPPDRAPCSQNGPRWTSAHQHIRDSHAHKAPSGPSRVFLFWGCFLGGLGGGGGRLAYVIDGSCFIRGHEHH